MLVGALFGLMHGLPVGWNSPLSLPLPLPLSLGMAGLAWRALVFATALGLGLGLGLVFVVWVAGLFAALRARIRHQHGWRRAWWTAPTLHLDVALDGALRPSLLHAVLRAAMVESWALGATRGVAQSDQPPAFCIDRLEGAAVHFKITAGVDWRGTAPGLARHTLLASVHKHLRFAGLRPVLPASMGATDAEQRPRDHQRPEDQSFVVDQVELFAVLSPFERRMLVSALFVKHLAAGAAAVHDGDPGQSMFIVAAGVVRVEGRGDVQGRAPAAASVLGPGDCCGALSMLTGVPHNATLTALLPSVLFEVPHTVMAELLIQRPELTDALAAAMAGTAAGGVGHVHASVHASDHTSDPSDLAARIAADMRQFFSALPHPT